MFAITEVRRNESVASYSFSDVTEVKKLSPTVTEYITSDPPTKKEVLSLPDHDVIIRQNVPTRKSPKLVIFDMDSTLINEECIDLLAAHAGVEPEVSKITQDAMNGLLDFSASLAARVALLKGLPVSVFDDVKSRITFASGARDVCKALKRMHVKTAVISGGFVPLAKYVQGELGIDYMHSNTLSSKDGFLIGTTEGSIVNAERKAELLQSIAADLGITIEETVAVGDGANDLPMLNKAGLGIAVHAKEMVQQAAPNRLRFGDLSTILHCFSLTTSEIEELLNAER